MRSILNWPSCSRPTSPRGSRVIAARLPEIARREDLELLEINPLVLTPDGRLVACDAKIIRDDSAAFRHDPGISGEPRAGGARA